MELIREVLVCVLKDEKVNISLPDADVEKMVDRKLYETLYEISEAVRDADTGDRECFERVEKLVRIFEKYGLDAGNRHDFG